MDNLVCKPIGVIHTAKRVKFDAPHQPANAASERNLVELYPGLSFEEGLRDLDGFERIWLVWWFHRNTSWRPMVQPPRGGVQRRGVFATRSPHRPNPIGITSVPLLEINGRTLIVGNCDLLDQTPILDIKPYISSVDAFADQRQGWLDEVEEELKASAQYAVELSPLAQEQIRWLKENWKIEFFEKVSEILARDPSPNRIRRITKAKSGIFRLSSGSWRVFFSVNRSEVRIHSVAPGFPQERLVSEGCEVIPDYLAQREFALKYLGG